MQVFCSTSRNFHPGVVAGNKIRVIGANAVRGIQPLAVRTAEPQRRRAALDQVVAHILAGENLLVRPRFDAAVN